MNFLPTILNEKRREVAAKKATYPQHLFCEKPGFSRKVYSLSAAMRRDGVNIIAEIKKASPSKGVIRQDFNPVQIASAFLAGGARALSVLTDGPFFQGDLSYLENVRREAAIPLLRKDFIIDSYQLYESKASGADAVLLIAAALERNSLHELKQEAEELGLECLVEVHDEHDLESIDGLDARLIGVNNRDLTTFKTDIGVSVRLRKMIPMSTTLISESGINTVLDIQQLMRNGIHAFLIGESLMRSEDPGKVLAQLLRGLK